MKSHIIIQQSLSWQLDVKSQFLATLQIEQGWEEAAKCLIKTLLMWMLVSSGLETEGIFPSWSKTNLGCQLWMGFPLIWMRFKWLTPSPELLAFSSNGMGSLTMLIGWPTFIFEIFLFLVSPGAGKVFWYSTGFNIAGTVCSSLPLRGDSLNSSESCDRDRSRADHNSWTVTSSGLIFPSHSLLILLYF